MSFKSSTEANEHLKKVLSILGDNWQGRIWDNLGWHCSWQWGSVTLHYTPQSKMYCVLIGDPGGCGGHVDLSRDLVASEDPIEVIRASCDSALQVIADSWKPIESSVSRVRLSL